MRRQHKVVRLYCSYCARSGKQLQLDHHIIMHFECTCVVVACGQVGLHVAASSLQVCVYSFASLVHCLDCIKKGVAAKVLGCHGGILMLAIHWQIIQDGWFSRRAGQHHIKKAVL
jgi:uncharacterized membrane protein YqgA involved in biofilm formation